MFDKFLNMLYKPKFSNFLISVDGIWGMWTEFSLCNRACGNGNYTRTRLCDSPENKHGGKPCPGPDTDDLEECNVEPCPGNALFYLFF